MVYKLHINENDGDYGISYIGKKIVTEINKVSNYGFLANNCHYDVIYISVPLLNIISDLPMFKVSGYPGVPTDIVGYIRDMKIYIDPLLNRNQIKLTFDPSKLRELKINSILETTTIKEIESIIEIESSLI